MMIIRIALHYYVRIGLANEGYIINNSNMTYLSLMRMYTIIAYIPWYTNIRITTTYLYHHRHTNENTYYNLPLRLSILNISTRHIMLYIQLRITKIIFILLKQHQQQQQQPQQYQHQHQHHHRQHQQQQQQHHQQQNQQQQHQQHRRHH